MSTWWTRLLKSRLQTLAFRKSWRDWIRLIRLFVERRFIWLRRLCRRHITLTRPTSGPLELFSSSFSTLRRHSTPKIDPNSKIKSKSVATIWEMHVKISWLLNASSSFLNVFNITRWSVRGTKTSSNIHTSPKISICKWESAKNISTQYFRIRMIWLRVIITEREQHLLRHNCVEVMVAMKSNWHLMQKIKISWKWFRIRSKLSRIKIRQSWLVQLELRPKG